MGRFGGYEIAGIIGRGGMGVVLKGFDAALNRFVAIKVLAPHLATSGAARRRFSREAQAAAAVVHDSVIAIHSVSEENSHPYVVMPYERGPSLQKRIDDHGPLAVVEVLRIGMQAAHGLAAAHAQGIVHRDVKPANILLSNGTERAKLTDFGLARAADDASLTRTGVIAGTPQYMSPEQARGEAVDQRSDLFSLGSVLYTMCTGRAPFRAETSYGILRRITDTDPRPIREINPDVPQWLCDTIARLMAKQPEDRFASAEEVADLLGAWLAHLQQPDVIPPPQPIAQPATSAGDGRKRLGLLKYLAGAAFACFLLLAGIVIVLELNKGTLRIECAADNIPVRITQGDKVVEKLTVSRSGESVRVAAGKYTVVIDGQIDGIELKDGVVLLKRGDTVTVRIVRSADSVLQVQVRGAQGLSMMSSLDESARKTKDFTSLQGVVFLFSDEHQQPQKTFYVRNRYGLPIRATIQVDSAVTEDSTRTRLKNVADTVDFEITYDDYVACSAGNTVLKVIYLSPESRVFQRYTTSGLSGRDAVEEVRGNGNLPIVSLKLTPTTESDALDQLPGTAASATSDPTAALVGYWKVTRLASMSADLLAGAKAVIDKESIYIHVPSQKEGHPHYRYRLHSDSGIDLEDADEPQANETYLGKYLLSGDRLSIAFNDDYEKSVRPVDPTGKVPQKDVNYFTLEREQTPAGNTGIVPGTASAFPASFMSLADAVYEFNQQQSQDPVGKNQPPLTEDEVIAAIFWDLEEGVGYETVRTRGLKKIADQRVLPDGWSIRGGSMVFDGPMAWHIFISDHSAENSTRSALSIRRQFLRPTHVDAPEPQAETDPDGVPLADAIEEFNAQRSPGDRKRHPPLTEYEVIAAIEFWQQHRDMAPVTDEDFAAFQRIAKTRTLPAQARLQLETQFERRKTTPDSGGVYTVWCIQIRMPRSGNEGSAFAYAIRQQFIARTESTASLDTRDKLTPTTDRYAQDKVYGNAEESVPGTVESLGDHELFRGVWKVEASEDGGRPNPQEDLRFAFSFDGERRRVQIWDADDGELEESGLYVIDATKRPRTIDFTQLRAFAHDPKNDPRSLGIYEFVGTDRLRICVSEEPKDGYPTKFASEPQSVNDVLLELRLVTKDTSALEGLSKSANEAAQEVEANRTPASERWKFQFPRDEREFARVLDFFGIELAVARQDAKELVYLSALSTASPTVRRGVGREESRTFFTISSGGERATLLSLAKKADIDTSGCLLILLFPEEVRKTLATLESTHADGRPLNQVQETVFGVRGTAAALRFHVISQQIRKETIPAIVNSLTLLADAVYKFNQQRSHDPVGKLQPPLTDDEVIASIREMGPQVGLGEQRLHLMELRAIADCGLLPHDWSLNALREIEFADGGKVDVWSVRLVCQRNSNSLPPDFTHTVRQRALKYHPPKPEALADKLDDERETLFDLVSNFSQQAKWWEETPESQSFPGIGPSLLVPTQPPLTVDEVVAAIRLELHGTTGNVRAEEAFTKELENIAATHTVPKGTVLDDSMGYRGVEFEFDIRGCYLKIPMSQEGITARSVTVRRQLIRSTKINKIRDDEIAWDLGKNNFRIYCGSKR